MDRAPTPQRALEARGYTLWLHSGWREPRPSPSGSRLIIHLPSHCIHLTPAGITARPATHWCWLRGGHPQYPTAPSKTLFRGRIQDSAFSANLPIAFSFQHMRNECFYFTWTFSLRRHTSQGHSLLGFRKVSTPVTSIPAAGHQPEPTGRGAFPPPQPPLPRVGGHCTDPSTLTSVAWFEPYVRGAIYTNDSRAPTPSLEVPCVRVTHPTRDLWPAQLSCRTGPRWGTCHWRLPHFVAFSSTWLL